MAVLTKGVRQCQFALSGLTSGGKVPSKISAIAASETGAMVIMTSCRTRSNGRDVILEAKVAVEPIDEASDWWAAVLSVFGGDSALERWKNLIRWFRGRPEFVDSTYSGIGNNPEGASGLLSSPRAL